MLYVFVSSRRNLSNKTYIFHLGTRANNLITSGTQYWDFAAQAEENARKLWVQKSTFVTVIFIAISVTIAIIKERISSLRKVWRRSPQVEYNADNKMLRWIQCWTVKCPYGSAVWEISSKEWLGPCWTGLVAHIPSYQLKCSRFQYPQIYEAWIMYNSRGYKFHFTSSGFLSSLGTRVTWWRFCLATSTYSGCRGSPYFLLTGLFMNFPQIPVVGE